jgi:CubicO group peptidase (beta-lactamase class C family)
MDNMQNMGNVIGRLEEFVRRKMEVDSIPGLAMAVTDRNSDLHVGTYGVSDIASCACVTKGTLFQIGSIGKSFTSIALLQLQERGRIDVHAQVTEYLPWFEVRSRHAPITLHHLMTHTAGIPIGSDDSIVPDSEVWNLRHVDASTPPGERFHYSNTGYKALGLVLEAVTGSTYAEVISTSILRPLGMTDTEPVITNAIRSRSAVGYTWLEDDRPPARRGPLAPSAWFESNTGDGCISSTPEDMTKYLRMLMNGGDGPNGRIMSRTSYDLLTSRYVFCGEDGRQEHYGYGLCVEEIDGRTLLNHTGGMVGYTSSLVADTDSGLGMIVLTNSLREPAEVSRFFIQAVHAAQRGEPLPEAAVPGQRHEPKAPSEYVGRYQGDAGVFEIHERGGLLRAVIGEDDVPMECVKEDLFRVDHPRYALFLLGFRRSEGTVVGAYHGSDEYSVPGRGEGDTGVPPSASHRALVGHYRSHNPWLTNFRVISRGGQLMFVEPSGAEHIVVPTGDHSFREAEPGSPETLSFGMFVGGRALMAVLSGGPYYRTFTP